MNDSLPYHVMRHYGRLRRELLWLREDTGMKGFQSRQSLSEKEFAGEQEAWWYLSEGPSLHLTPLLSLCPSLTTLSGWGDLSHYLKQLP